MSLATVPNGKYEIKPANLVRAIPLVTSPFLRAKQHIDFWFVPYNLLWSRFNEFMVNKDEKLSSALNGRAFLPHMYLKKALDAVKTNNPAEYNVDIVGMPAINGMYRLLDSLGYPTFNHAHDISIGENYDKAVNLWPILAYNYIWYTQYRQDYYDNGEYGPMGDVVGKSSRLFNVDYLSCTSEANSDITNDSIIDTQLLSAMFQMRYRCWKKDLFTGLMPSTQFGNLSTLNNQTPAIVIMNDVLTTSNDRNRWNGNSGGDPTQVYIGNTPTNLYSGTTDYTHTHSFDLSDAQAVINADSFRVLDVLSLRKAEALQIWRENALRAGNKLEDNFEAHYGSKPKSHLHHHATLIGSIDAPLNIGDIDSHAQISSDGSNQQLADVAGKGLSTLNNGTFKFQASDFGIIIGIHSILPETEYMSTGIARENQLLEMEDYFIPEYARLGLTPVDSSTFYFGADRSVNLGYAPHDFGYKQKLDKVHLDFFNLGENAGDRGIFASWASPKYDVYDAIKYISTQGNLNVMPLECLYINPSLFDVNFAVGVENSRQFLIDNYFNIDAIQPMPVTGMPSY